MSLRAGAGVQEVRDVRVRVRAESRSARLAYFPAYELRYSHGETFNVHGERVPEEFLALIGGTGGGGGGRGRGARPGGAPGRQLLAAVVAGAGHESPLPQRLS